MTASMELGIEFMGVSEKFSLSTTYEEEFKKTVTEITKITTMETISMVCGIANNGVNYGLWQWIVETEDMSYTARAKHAVCRSGANATTPPACPWDACFDDECTVCNDGWAA